MKIVLIAPANSIHTIRWANGLAELGHEVHLISKHVALNNLKKIVNFYHFPFYSPAGYFFIAVKIRKLLNKIMPDIVNAHYASGYGTTARFVNYSPWVLSIWGSDVYNFPYKSFIHKWIINKNLYAADAIASTSKCMAKQALSISPMLSDITITPFGVNTKTFISNINKENNQLTIGTVKSLSPIYGIDTLIKSFSILIKKLEAKNHNLANQVKLRIVGHGSQEQELKTLAFNLGIADKTTFVGSVSHENVPKELNKLDIYVALSREESFGVAIIEAGAAGKPVIVSEVGGLPEVVLNKKSGLIVPKDNPQAAANAMMKFINNPKLRKQYGEYGRKHVAENYSWNICLNKMVKCYEKTIYKSIKKPS